MESKNDKNRFGRRYFIGNAAATVAGFMISPADVKASGLNKTNNSLNLPLEEPFAVYNVCKYGLVGDGATASRRLRCLTVGLNGKVYLMAGERSPSRLCLFY